MTAEEGRGRVPQQTVFSLPQHLHDALQDDFANQDSSSNPTLNPPTPSNEPKADSELQRPTHYDPASENTATTFVLTPDQDYHNEYPQGVNNLENTNNDDYLNNITVDEIDGDIPNTPTNDVTPNLPSGPGSVVPAVNTCSEGQFECVDGSACLPSVAVCDGSEQCDDGSDEGECQRVGESPEAFPSLLLLPQYCVHLGMTIGIGCKESFHLAS